MPGSATEDEDTSEFARVVQENHRPWAGYWAWKDKPVMELSAARAVLTAAGIEFHVSGADRGSRTRLTVRP